MANIFGNVISDSEGRDGSFIVRRIRSAVPRDQKVTNSRHNYYDGAKVNKVFARFESESARRRHCLCSRPAPTPLVEIFTGPSTTTGTRSNDGEGDDFFCSLRGSFKCMIVFYFTNVLTRRSCLGFLLTADSQCFTRNEARTFVPTIPRRRLWLGERSL